MRILISVITITLSCKIKMKSNKAFTEALIRILSEIFNENHITLNDHSDKIKIDQNSVFSSVNTIITEKTIFVLNAVFQIIQLEIVNFLLISIKCLQRTITSNCSSIRCE